MAETTTGMTSTTNTGSPLVTMARARRKKKSSGNFIKGAIKRPGSLHTALSVPQNQRIPASKLARAARSGNKNLKAKANFAKTLKSFR